MTPRVRLYACIAAANQGIATFLWKVGITPRTPESGGA
jgi:hypothetical protein